MTKFKEINIKFKDVVTYITIFVMFTDTFSYNFSFYYRFKFYNLILFFVLTWLTIELIRKFQEKIHFGLFADFITDLFIKKTLFVILLILLFFSSLSNYLLGNVTFLLLGKQLLGFLLHSLVFYLLIEYNNRDVRKLFLIYLNFAFFVALFGLIQVSAYILRAELVRFVPIIEKIFFRGDSTFCGIFPLHFVTMFGFQTIRLNSIMIEPYSFCVVMMPAFFVALTTFMKDNFKFLSKIKSLVIIVSFFLSFSLVGYIGMYCAILLLLSKSKLSKLKCFIVIISLVIVSCSVVTPFRERIESAYKVFTGKIIPKAADPSTYTLFRNTAVTFDVFNEGWWFCGKGLGSHMISYDSYTEKFDSPVLYRPNYKWGLNRQDAGSLFLRLLSEVGLFGLLVFILFIARNYINANKDPTHYLWVINNSILILFIIRLIRQGNYFSEGFFFFIWLYYFSKKLMIKNHSQAASVVKDENTH